METATHTPAAPASQPTDPCGPSSDLEVHELALCESQRLVLRPGVLYRFTADRTCLECQRLLDLGTGAGFHPRFRLTPAAPASGHERAMLYTAAQVAEHAQAQPVPIQLAFFPRTSPASRWSAGARFVNVATGDTVATEVL